MIPTWETLNKLSNSKLAKLTIIAPVAGWILVYNDSIVGILSSSLGVRLEPVLDWKLHVFYIGLIAISASVLVFSLRCPGIVSSYGDFVNYATSERRLFTATYDKAISLELRIPPLKWKGNPVEDQTLADEAQPLQIAHANNEDSIIEQLRLIYYSYNESRPISRGSVAVLFLVGAMLSTIPTISTLVWSTCSILNL